MVLETRFCVRCKDKVPPVDTVLDIGVNIKEARYNRSDYTCDECYKERQKRYQSKEQWADYLRELKDETIEALTTQWNDPAYKNMKEMADRVVKVWDKYERRSPSTGIRRDWICEVIFQDLWHIDANGIVEDFFRETNKTKGQQIGAKSYLLEFVSNDKILSLLQSAYKDKARNRWAGVVDAIIRKYSGRASGEKIVASPSHEDPYTKEKIDNWFLLSGEMEREIREMKREAMKKRLDDITAEEKTIVQHIEEIQKRQKAKQSRQQDDEQDANSGGENK